MRLEIYEFINIFHLPKIIIIIIIMLVGFTYCNKKYKVNICHLYITYNEKLEFDYVAITYLLTNNFNFPFFLFE